MEEKKVEPFFIERPCQAKFDKTQLALKDVDRTTRHYSKKILVLKDFEITRIVTAPPGDPDFVYSGVKRTYFFGLELRHRQEWDPTGYGLGELINTISLLPNEELTLEVKTWETSKTQQDEEKSLESKNISDVKVEKSDVKEILDDYQEKTKHQVDVEASANWGWGSASAKYGFSNEVATQHKTLSKRAQDVVQKAVNEVSSKRAIKIGISRESGSEEKTTRKIKNINQCRTLNINFYQILREYTVKLYIDNVNLLLFGPWDYKETWDNYIKAGWDLEGIMLQQLKEQALDFDGESFIANVSPYVIPRPDAVMITNEKKPRAIYAYEVIPGFMNGDPKDLKKLLNYLSKYDSPNSPPAHMGKMEIIKEQEFLDLKEKGETLTMPSKGVMYIPIVHFLSGIPRNEFLKEITKVNNTIVRDYVKTLEEIGKVQTSWTVTIPTHGIHAESSLGLCSGCEDYFEIQRQLDLELKRVEIEKLRLEVEKLAILNQKTQQSTTGNMVTIKNPPENSSIQLNVDVTSGEEDTQVSFEE